MRIEESEFIVLTAIILLPYTQKHCWQFGPIGLNKTAPQFELDMNLIYPIVQFK